MNGCLRLITPNAKHSPIPAKPIAAFWSLAKPAQRVADSAEGPMPLDERVDGAEYVDILREAVAARNGWSVSLRGVYFACRIAATEIEFSFNP